MFFPINRFHRHPVCILILWPNPSFSTVAPKWNNRVIRRFPAIFRDSECPKYDKFEKADQSLNHQQTVAISWPFQPQYSRYPKYQQLRNIAFFPTGSQVDDTIMSPLRESAHRLECDVLFLFSVTITLRKTLTNTLRIDQQYKM